jgi:hypothetical protein
MIGFISANRFSFLRENQGPADPVGAVSGRHYLSGSITMDDFVTLTYQDKTYRLPVIVGSEGERAIDILQLRADAGLITYDPGFANTGAC